MTKIKDLPLNERPREKGIIYGVETLSDGELIAIILSTGTKNKSSVELANEIIFHAGGLKRFSSLSFQELCQEEGINTSKAMKLIASFELAKRINQKEYNDLSKFSSLEYLSKYFINLIGEETVEKVYVVLFNHKDEVIGIRNIYKGKQNKAKSFILIHNHPSGQETPSSDDKKQTSRLIILSNMYQLNLKDHIIVTSKHAFSIRRELVII